MADHPKPRRRLYVVVRATYARWPGGQHMLVRMSIDGVPIDSLLLYDREGRRHELRPHRVGARLVGRGQHPYGCH